MLVRTHILDIKDLRSAKVRRAARKATAQEHADSTETRGRKPRAVLNSLSGTLRPQRVHTESDVFDDDDVMPEEDEQVVQVPQALRNVVDGVARLDWDGSNRASKPLSALRMLHLLQHLPEITTAAVQAELGLEQRHARRYAQACELSLKLYARST